MTERDASYNLLQDSSGKRVRFSDQNIEPVAPDMNEEAKRKLIIVCCVCSCFMIIEFVGGLLSNSLAIMTDAAHLLSDLAGFVISIFAIYIASFPKNKTYTFGYHRAEIVGALISVFTIWVLTIMLFIESISRIIESHHKVDGLMMLITSSIGLVFNLIMVYILHSKVFFILTNRDRMVGVIMLMLISGLCSAWGIPMTTIIVRTNMTMEVVQDITTGLAVITMLIALVRKARILNSRDNITVSPVLSTNMVQSAKLVLILRKNL
jgi:cation diffusion facilitator family transporter